MNGWVLFWLVVAICGALMLFWPIVQDGAVRLAAWLFWITVAVVWLVSQ